MDLNQNQPTQLGSFNSRTSGVLILETGQEYSGSLFGAQVSLESMSSSQPGTELGYGEVVFNTSMTGYQEILTDPSYYGQIICMTAAHIGNTGVNPLDTEGARVRCGGLIVRDLCETPSNWRKTHSLEKYLVDEGIPGICDVDTRALTRNLRSRGVVRGLIVSLDERSKALEVLSRLPKFENRDLIREVSTQQPYHYKPDERAIHMKQSCDLIFNVGPSITQTTHVLPQNPLVDSFRVTVIDYGVKSNLLRSLWVRGCELLVLPASSTADEIMATRADGVFLSNGPGDPTAAPYAIDAVKQLIGRVPLFGVCMGHQILALALGGQAYKMKFGHRGGNQPVLNPLNKQVEISSHNHGYSIDANSLPSDVLVTHLNLNDQTVEGIEVAQKNAFSVQFHPESCPGPHDSFVHFDRFIENMRKVKAKV